MELLRAGRVGVAGLLLVALVWGLHASPARAASEDQVMAAFLYNFAKFVEWPENSFAASDTPIVIGVIGDPAFERLLATAVDGKSVKGRAIEVVGAPSASALSDRHIVFVPADASAEAMALASAGADQPVLTVADQERFARSGGMVGFTRENGKIRFEINDKAAQRAGLRISSRLLGLAVKVY